MVLPSLFFEFHEGMVKFSKSFIMEDTKRMQLPIKAYRPIQSLLQCVITKRVPAVFPFDPHGVSCQGCRKQFVVASNHCFNTLSTYNHDWLILTFNEAVPVPQVNIFKRGNRGKLRGINYVFAWTAPNYHLNYERSVVKLLGPLFATSISKTALALTLFCAGWEPHVFHSRRYQTLLANACTSPPRETPET